MTSLIFLSLINIQARFTQPQSPDGRYKIVHVGRDLGDANSEITYYVIETTTHDTTFTTQSIIHDFLPPVFLWTADSRKLIYEQRNVFNSSTPSVNVFDLYADSLLLSVNGFINARPEQAPLYFDQNRVYVFYFYSSAEAYQLMALDLNNLKSFKLLDFKHHDPPMKRPG